MRLIMSLLLAGVLSACASVSMTMPGGSVVIGG